MPLFQHSRREQWGLALLAWEGPDTRRYQFQDGHLRTFKKGFYHLFVEVDRPLEETWEAVSELTQKLDLTRARRDRLAEVEAKGQRKMLTLDDQLAIFAKLFPEGFEGYQWRAKVRGTAAARRLKAHRQPAIDGAREKLSLEALDALIEAGDFQGVIDIAYEVGRGTDLVRPKQDLSLLRELEPEQVEAAARALRGLLWDEGPYRDRMKAWIGALSRGKELPTWQLVTVFPALVHPKEHVCVRPSVFRAQAAWMAPRLKYSAEPSAAHYARYRAMAKLVRKTVREKGDLRMADMLDAYEFMWRTLRPSARKLLEESK